MITAAVDSAGRAGGIALLDEDKLIYESYLDIGLTHSETLLPMLKNALAAARLTPAEVGLWAVSAGPGSFTGLRIGMALVKGLALPANTPCVGVSTLCALAASVFLPEGSDIVAAVDARRGEVYAAAFTVTATGLHRLCEDTVGLPKPLLEPVLAGRKNPLFLIGDGAKVCYNSLEENQDQKTPVILPEHLSQGRASGAAFAARRAFLEGEWVTAEKLTPAYHRLSQAQRERQEKLAQQQKGSTSE